MSRLSHPELSSRYGAFMAWHGWRLDRGIDPAGRFCAASPDHAFSAYLAWLGSMKRRAAAEDGICLRRSASGWLLVQDDDAFTEFIWDQVARRHVEEAA